MLVISALTGSVYVVVRDIKETDIPVANSTATTYSIVFNDFGNGQIGHALYLVVTVLKSIGLIIIMVVVNSFLLLEMNRYYQRKLKLTRKVRTGIISVDGLRIIK
jgi:hypothetical protein